MAFKISNPNVSFGEIGDVNLFRELSESCGIDPDGNFGFSGQEMIAICKAIPELDNLYHDAEPKLENLNFYKTLVDEKFGIEATGEAVMLPSGNWDINLSYTRIKSNLDFVYTFGAELLHVLYNCDMDYNSWKNRPVVDRFREEYSVHSS
ncbi:hypothetical protein [Flavobacterium sp.]|uniref:hypothetical protein n=1 Tax=Flavobacterium sp. TaxID=239 RepID=UPI00261BFC26|nr:hypothetical protein [Flavobacterium sp.]